MSLQKVGPWLLVLCDLALHFINLNYPNQVIFDEVHFGKFVTAYCCTGQYFFDIHPPHAKLLIAGTAYLFGYRGGFDFDHIGEAYGTLPIFALRLFPALTGILLPLLFYALLRQLGVSWEGSLFGGAVLLLDNALLIQTRIIALDGLLLLATFGSVSAWLATQRSSSQARWWLAALTGVAVGLSVGSKFTGLVAPLLVALMSVVHSIRHRQWRRELSLLVVMGVVAVCVYSAGWALHFSLLTNPGPGDAWGRPVWTGHLLPDFVQNTIKLHQQMLSANYNLKAPHPDASPWWSWPLMLNPVYYWYGGPQVAIYFIGNPVVWWGGTALFIIALIGWLFEVWPALRTGLKNCLVRKYWIPVVGFVLALAPLTGVPRALFMYHYLTPLLFSLVAGLLWLDKRLTQKRMVYSWMALVLLLGFLYVSPVTYGFAPAWYDWLAPLLR